MTGHDLLTWRTAAGLSQHQAAELLGTVPRYLRRLERSDRPLSPPMIARLEAAIDFPEEDIEELAARDVIEAARRRDGEREADRLLAKLLKLRIFSDEAGKMNKSVADCGGALLIVSQFTLYGDCRKGRRPSFDHAAAPELANRLYEYFVAQVRRRSLRAETGVFQACMAVHLINDGPVTLILDSNRVL